MVGVHDGDTFTILDGDKHQERIRVAGIDAPETDQAFGKRSGQELSKIVFRRDVELFWSKRDRYGRPVAKVMVADPDCLSPECPKIHDAGLMQAKAGMAWHSKRYQREQSEGDRLEYAEAEQQARAAHIGLWQDKNPIPPWEWRRMKREKRHLKTTK